MTKELKAAIAIIVSQLETIKNVLEIGSRTATNQEEIGDLRSLFDGARYVGVDMQEGPGVDKVADARELPYKDKSFDLVIALETLEHSDEPWKIVEEAERVMKKKGYLIISSQQNFPLHMHPADYFRFTPYGLASLVKKSEHKLMISISPPFDDEVRLNPQHVIVVAWNGEQKIKNKIKKALQRRSEEINIHKPYRHRVQDGLKKIKRGFEEVNYRTEIFFPSE
jgi:SAM-dependent methyltransferase